MRAHPFLLGGHNFLQAFRDLTLGATDGSFRKRIPEIHV